jgi:hypothetical protein
MTQLRRWVACTASFLVMAVGGWTKETWIYARSPHFDVYSTLNERHSRELVNDLEQFRAAFRTAFRLPLTGESPVTVVVFESEKQFEPYLPLYKGKPKQLAGYCAARPTGTFIALTTSFGWEHARKTIFHEYVHRLVQEGGLRIPTWLNEGVATVYATAEITEESFTVGHPDPRYLLLLRNQAPVPLSRLIGITQTSAEYNESDQKNIFYATSWGLSHYLICGVNGDNRGKMARFTELISDPSTDPVIAFKAAFDTDLTQLEGQLRSYVRSGKYTVRTAKVEVPDLKKSLRFEPANEIAKQVALEYLRYGRSTHDPGNATIATRRPGIAGSMDTEAVQRIQELTLRAPNAPEPYAALAALSLAHEKNLNQAKFYWRKAVELGSQDPYVYYQLATSELRDVMRGLTLDYRMPPAIADPIRADLMKAVELRPDYYDAWESLAILEAVAKQMNQGNLQRIQQIATDERRTQRMMMALALVRWRIRDFPTCRQILASIGQDPRDPFIVNMRRRLATRLDKDEAKAAAESTPPAASM